MVLPVSDHFRNLVFEGGGVKGIAYAGALQALQARGILQDIRRVAGTSVGAIAATLIAVGYTADEAREVIANTNFNQFTDDSFGVIRDTARVLRDYGWYKGDAFHDWLGERIAEKLGDADLPFSALRADVAANSELRELYIAGSNLTQQRVEIYSPEHTPDMPIRDAVRISMSIPLFFKAIELDGDVLVDGGVAWNYPVNVFDHIQYVLDQRNAAKLVDVFDDDYRFNHETLGFRLGTREQTDRAAQDWLNVPRAVDNILDYSISLGYYLFQMANQRHLNSRDWRRTVFIDTLNVNPVDFNLPRERINQLIDSGRDGVRAYFAWRDGENFTLPV